MAVVANEVEQLAAQTAHSTADIARHIGKVRSATAASVAAVEGIEQTITEISGIADSIAMLVEQQGVATAEIARNVAETAGATSEMTALITEVSVEATETARHATDVRDNSAGLNDAVEGLRHSVIQVVRTATPEVNRRDRQRFEVDLPCSLMVGGATHVARIADL